VNGCPVCARLTSGRCAAHAFSILPDASIVNPSGPPDYGPPPGTWPAPSFFSISTTPVHTCYRYDSDSVTILRQCQAHCACPCHPIVPSSPADRAVETAATT
jgi:hypothetical protein